MVKHFRNTCGGSAGSEQRRTLSPNECNCGSCMRIFEKFDATAWTLQRLELQHELTQITTRGGMDPDTAARLVNDHVKGIRDCAHRASVKAMEKVKKARQALTYAIDDLDTNLCDEEAVGRIDVADLIKEACVPEENANG